MHISIVDAAPFYPAWASKALKGNGNYTGISVLEYQASSAKRTDPGM